VSILSIYKLKKDLKDVLKGGKDYPYCSFMDISVRDDRLEARKKELINFIGAFVLNKIEDEELKC
jgi:alkylhydroperoxidase/carboxymuconolactone decarboxylase family protein YurZ